LARHIGSVDARGRPLLRLAIQGAEDEILVVVDTGFNGDLFISLSDAGKLGIRLSGIEEKVEVAGGVVQRVDNTTCELMWFGKPRLVDVIIGLEPAPPRREEDPIALIGTGLLKPHLLLIDYAAGTVEIERQD
jgi:predicted aspartyl protease